jgi:hypothetical protein
MDAYTEIKNKIRAMQGQRTPLLLTGKVESVDDETCTVSVGDLKLTGVRLRSVVNGEASKLLITPKTGSYVTVIDLSGELRETEVLGYSEIEAIDIETGSDININCNGTVTFNGGKNHGMAKVEAVANKLKAIEVDLNSLKQVLTAWMPVVYDGGASLKAGITGWATKQIQPTTHYTDLENDKIKH